jgi:hypothetical protein
MNYTIEITVVPQHLFFIGFLGFWLFMIMYQRSVVYTQKKV